ncbi:MAG: hypothetical protein HFJ52_08785 [Clostridia bacterium]|jgi:hypothetical protein|nr:hypothetical protein [Clostridia bacterium]
MAKIFTKVLICMLVVLCVITIMSFGRPVKASIGMSPYTCEGTSFTFKGTFRKSYNCTGMFLDVTCKATASNNNNETITLSVFVNNTGKTHTYTFLSDGQPHTLKNVFLGLSGGSNVGFTFTGANPEITIYTSMDIMS